MISYSTSWLASRNDEKEIIKQAKALLEKHLQHCYIYAGAISEIAPYLEQQQYSKVALVVDSNTYEAAGKQLEQLLLRQHVHVTITTILANKVNDIVADEASIVQLLLDIQQEKPEVVIAVGGGTIHDITRYAAYSSNLSFISVPTAPSVDGFNSIGAPIITRGYKRTITAIGPEAVFADLDILMRAPQSLIAAGFGDMLGKYTSLFDWNFGALINDEPYLAQSEWMTRTALERCVNAASLIGRKDEEGMATLIQGLMESGVAMLVFGQSHPASGAEHHLSHYWEMEFIAQERRQLLHGAKVGCAAVEISRLYHQLVKEDWGSTISSHDRIAQYWSEIKQFVNGIPEAEQLASWLSQVNGPAHYSELSIPEELFARSMKEAHNVRKTRFTLLHALNTAY